MADDKKTMAAFRFSPTTHARLDRLAEGWHVAKVGVLEHAVHVLADPEIGAAVGDGFQAAEQGLRCWAELLSQAAADNAQTFVRDEWNLVADANNGCSPTFAMAGEDFRAGVGPTLLWANVADAIRLDGADRKWLGDGKSAAKRGRELVEKLRSLDFVHGWAAVVAVQFFWQHCQEIDHTQDEWWQVSFRRDLLATGTGDAKLDRQSREFP